MVGFRLGSVFAGMLIGHSLAQGFVLAGLWSLVVAAAVAVIPGEQEQREHALAP